MIKCITMCYYFMTLSFVFFDLFKYLESADSNETSFRQSLLSGSKVKLEVSPNFLSVGFSHKIILREINDSLNLTCTVVQQNGVRNDSLFQYDVDWKEPSNVKDNPRIERGQDTNVAWLWLKSFNERDEGNYTCNAINSENIEQPPMSIKITLSLKKKKPEICGSQWYKCKSNICIPNRFICDGKKDCKDGDDESVEAGCKSDPCAGKIKCDNRCVPLEWCCTQFNCNNSTYGLRPWPSETHEISYVQTAFYTVIGCAMAFMFIVTILVIAICRVQIKRAMNSRWSQQNRETNRRTSRNTFFNVDNYPQEVNIMYNINSGVQFVGHPVEPPPYSEVISSPPREGPPPPYVSCENLVDEPLRANDIIESNDDCISSATNQQASSPLLIPDNGLQKDE